MPQVRRRRALRSSVLAASLAVLASLVVVPPAAAEDAPVTTTAPTTSSSPTDATSSPTTAAPSTSGTDATSDAPSSAPITSGAAPATGAEPSDETPAPGETVVGELQQAWPDPTAEEHAHDANDGHEGHEGHEDHSGEEPLSWIDTGDGTAVRVPTDALPDVPVGSTLAVTVGDQVVDEASTEQGFAPAVEVQAAEVVDAASVDPTTASAGTTPTNTVTAVLVLPSGASPDGMTISTFVNTLNGDVSSFWDEQSNGLVRISAVQGASGWVSSTQTCSSPFALWSDVAQRIGWTEGAGKHLMLYVPGSASGCAYGLGTVGSSIGSGGYSYVRAAKLSVMGHELGHNFGLGHSSELQCESTLESGTCRTRDYYDFYDIMGISWDQVGTLNAVQAARLGLLPSSEQVALTTSSAPTTVSLVPVSAASGTRAVKLTAANGAVYYLEYRQASGRDSWLGDSRNAYGLNSGVVLRRASSGGNTSLLLDGTPSASSGWNGDMQQALPVGTSIPVAGGSFSVAVLSTSTGGASLRVVGGGSTAMVMPRGNWESLTVSGATVGIAGWAYDPDQPTTSSTVHVYVDGVGQALTADGDRPDVAAATPGAGAAHGFSASRTVAPGRHTACVYAIDVDFPSSNTPLGCRDFVTQATLPYGNWESLAADGASVSVAGWSVDVDQPTSPVHVHAYVDGQWRGVVADGSRPDVGSAFPGAGSAHGFTASFPVPPGAHDVCLYAIDLDVPAWNTPLGCRRVATQVQPAMGNWEILDVAGPDITVRGWALDMDQRSTAVAVHAYVDGAWHGLSAGAHRPDVGAAYPGAGSAHGFNASWTVRPGQHQVCLYAIDPDARLASTALGCRTTGTQVAAPYGNWEALTVSGTTISVRGWALDPDHMSASSQVHVYVGGAGQAVTASDSRPDVGSAIPGAGSAHGFSASANVPRGMHQVCVYAIDTDLPAGNTPLGCRDVTVP